MSSRQSEYKGIDDFHLRPQNFEPLMFDYVTYGYSFPTTKMLVSFGWSGLWATWIILESDDVVFVQRDSSAVLRHLSGCQSPDRSGQAFLSQWSIGRRKEKKGEERWDGETETDDGRGERF
jgi:hypothetical protein